MKFSYFPIAVFTASMLVLSYCKEKTPEPVATAQIAYTPIVSWTKAGQVPIIYEGDTVKYNITATATADITELNVYKVDIATSAKTLLAGYPKTTFTNKRSISDQVYLPVGTKADFKSFYLSIETKEGTPVATKATDKYSALSEVTFQKNLRLAFKGSNYSVLINYILKDTLVNNDFNRYSINLYDLEKWAKISGIGTAFVTSDWFDNGKLTVYNYSLFSISNDNIDLINSPDEIKGAYIKNSGSAKYYQLCGENSVLNCKLKPNKDTIQDLPTYGILKITKLFDDGNDDIKTSNSVNDYLIFDIKLYNPYRFK